MDILTMLPSFSRLRTTEDQQERRFCRVSRRFRSGNLISKALKEAAIESFHCRIVFF